ncbi:MAG: hypothetical protein NTU49_02780 [Gammaproteobacteria bacterium]|nr:hypothetical protein [Gammaproteobacteria bacterium]
MHISKLLHFAFPDPAYKKPKVGYLRYFEDMHQFTSTYLDEKMLMQSSGYSFPELIDLAINKEKTLLPALNKSDLCVITHDSYEYDSNYSHVSPYLVEKYNIQADFFDLIGKGGLENAFHILEAYFDMGKINNAVILEFAQRALPLRITKNTPLPEFNRLDVFLIVE